MKHRSKQRRQAKLETTSTSIPVPTPTTEIAPATSIAPDVPVIPKYQPNANDVKNALAVLDLPTDTKYDDIDLQIVFTAYKKSLALVAGTSIGSYLALSPTSVEQERSRIEAAAAILFPDGVAAYQDKQNQSQPPHKVAAQVTFLSPLVEEVPAAPPAVLPVANAPAKPTVKPAALPIFAAPVFEDTTTRVSILEPMIVDLGPELDEELTAVPSQPPHFVLDPEHIDGATIRQQRELCGLSLDDLAAQTKIRKNYLQAIEANDATVFASRVYLRGFLTQIARVLKVDKDVLADGYLRSLDAPR